MKNFYALTTAFVLYLVFFLAIDSKFAADFKQYLFES